MTLNSNVPQYLYHNSPCVHPPVKCYSAKIPAGSQWCQKYNQDVVQSWAGQSHPKTPRAVSGCSTSATELLAAAHVHSVSWLEKHTHLSGKISLGSEIDMLSVIGALMNSMRLSPACQDPTPCFLPENHFLYCDLKNLTKCVCVDMWKCLVVYPTWIPDASFSFRGVVPSAWLILIWLPVPKADGTG